MASFVRGILSKTADTQPRPKAVCHDAAGNVSTGISDAHVTRVNKNSVPFTDAGTTFQSVETKSAETTIAIQTPAAGKSSSTFVTTAPTRISATTTSLRQSMSCRATLSR